MADAKKETKTVAKAQAAEQTQKQEETTGVTRRLAKTTSSNNTSVAALVEKDAKAAEKTTAKKTTAKKATAAKKTTKAVAEKKTAVKKTAAKKTTAKAAEKKPVAKKEVEAKATGLTANVALQYYGKDRNINEIIEDVKKSYVADGHKSTSIKSLNVYLKPEEGFAYFVINESYAGKVDLF